MTSFRQIEANRGNVLRSTGPKTEAGKRRSRRNAVRHGLTAETLVVALEDIEDYQAFEAAIIADYDARTAVSASWCSGLHRSCGAPLRPISFSSRPEILSDRRYESKPTQTLNLVRMMYNQSYSNREHSSRCLNRRKSGPLVPF
jgi:hypothetical protein